MKVMKPVFLETNSHCQISINLNREELGVVQVSGQRSAQEVADYNETRDDCHTHKFQTAMVKLDLIIHPSVDIIKIGHDNDQFQVKFMLLSSILQKAEYSFPSEPERWVEEIHPTNRPGMMCQAELCAIKYECTTDCTASPWCPAMESLCLI